MRRTLHVLLLLLTIPECAPAQETYSAKLGVEYRAFTASKVGFLVQRYFFSPTDTPTSEFDASYKIYQRTAFASYDRRRFDLATIEFVAQLHNGHTFFWDAWLDKDNQQPLGFYAAPLGGYWVVRTSFLPGVKPGDIVVSIEQTATETFFQEQQRYISGSSIEAQRHNLFLLPYLFPERFILTLDGNRKVTIDRSLIKEPQQKTEGKWIKPGIAAYIRIPQFFRIPFEEDALAFVQQFQSAKTLIIDVRNNSGGSAPKRLIQALMDRPYHEWKESTNVRVPFVDFANDTQKGRDATIQPQYFRGCKYSADDNLCTLPVTWGGEIVAPTPNAFHGRVILLVDGGCISACEEMVEPFKDGGRATIVGETTQGSSGLPYFYNFGNGMTLKIAVKRLYFPNGSEFEGVGIKPDVEVHPSIESLKAGRDVILEKAIEVAEKP